MSLVQTSLKNRTAFRGAALRGALLAGVLGTAAITFAVAQNLPDGATSRGGLISDSQLSDGYMRRSSTPRAPSATCR